jgi:DNA-binding GntR family transcriptional regulator
MPRPSNGQDSAPEVIAAEIRDELLDGTVAPGARLTEEALTARFSAGRHSVRAAIRILVAQGLLVHERNRGAVTPQITEQRIDEMFSYRSVLELGALRMALISAADFRDVAAAVDHLDALPENAPWRSVVDAHAAIHHEIAVSSGNERIIKAHTDCEAELTFMFASVKGDYSARRLAILHRHLLEQIYVGGDVALRALEDDLELGGRSALHLALRRQRESQRRLTADHRPP